MAVVAEKQLRFRLPGPQTAAALLAWYDREQRSLPWRRPSAKGKPNAYRVWLSEIMLQQTTVRAVIPYYRAFLARWPTVQALAAAPSEEVLAAWAGLGYYSRARNLHKCAGIVAGQHGGRFPASEDQLLELPGIGPYTAAAIAAIAFGAPVVPVDANVERVVARLFAVEKPPAAAKAEIRRLAQAFAHGRRSGDSAQALMDLGASICTPKRPSCLMCPICARLRRPCAGAGDASSRAHRQARAPPAQRHRLPRHARGRLHIAAQAATRRGCWAACWRCPRRTGAMPFRP